VIAAPVRGLPQYHIGPEDVLDVFVYRAPELSGVAPVRPDGRISTPLSSDVVALGRTPTQLAQAIEANLKKYVKEPNVTVMVTGFRGEPDLDIHVVGEVGRLRAIPYSAQLSLLDVVIEAGGLTRFAAANRTLLVREGPHGPVTYRVRLADLIEDGDMTQNIPMRPGDTVIVPQAWF
jgi:polysaccharide export outer membrane protein